jgi:hypothetical protein
VSQKKLIHLIFKWITKVSVFFDSPCIYKADFHSVQMLRDRLFAIAFFWNTNSQAEQITLAVVHCTHLKILRHFVLNGNPLFPLANFCARSYLFPLITSARRGKMDAEKGKRSIRAKNSLVEKWKPALSRQFVIGYNPSQKFKNCVTPLPTLYARPE